MAQVQQIEKVLNDIHIANIVSQFQYTNDANHGRNLDIDTNSVHSEESNESTSIIPSEYQKVILSENSNENQLQFKSQRLEEQQQAKEKKESNKFNIVKIDNVKKKRSYIAYYDIEYLKNQAINMMRNNGLSFQTAFKCPNNHSLYTYPFGFGNCHKCGINLQNNPCRHCKICGYIVCLQCYKVSASNCPDYHGLVQYSPDSNYELIIIYHRSIHICI